MNCASGVDRATTPLSDTQLVENLEIPDPTSGSAGLNRASAPMDRYLSALSMPQVSEPVDGSIRFSVIANGSASAVIDPAGAG